MEKGTIYEEIKKLFYQLLIDNALLEESIAVKGRVLKTEEAIGSPQRQDFPLVKGREKLMQATFKGAYGQAFTDMPGSFSGKLREITARPLDTNFDLAVLVSSLNAVMRYLGLIDRTVHCKDDEPEQCAKGFVDSIKGRFGPKVKVALVGYQPAFVEHFARAFSLRVLDLDPDRVGKEFYGVLIEDGLQNMDAALKESELIIATGSTLTNGTFCNYINRNKPVIFYGTTVAGVAKLLNYERFCLCAQ
jgi:hypothetical protein